MKKTVIESPYAANKNNTVEDHLEYLRECFLDCLQRDESPYASHSFIPKVLNDDDPKERELGINAGLEWARVADNIAVYLDMGISKGMAAAILTHLRRGKMVDARAIRADKRFRFYIDPAKGGKENEVFALIPVWFRIAYYQENAYVVFVGKNDKGQMYDVPLDNMILL